MDITIFYSWQSKTEQKKNRYYIKDCIDKAYKKLQKDLPSFTFKLLESVDKKSGSPAIASTIMDERIPHCDIFIADLSVTDKYSTLEKIRNHVSKKKCRDVHQANNVMIEYGIAYNSIGNDCIIGVLNKDYGSPNDNEENIPFDIRHLRYPIEYQFNKNKKDFIDQLKKAINSCTITAIENRKNKFKPFISWYEYRNRHCNQSDFYKNDVTISISTKIRNSQKDIRFLGLSGLGKTRITFESFKEDDENILFDWLYCDCQLHEESTINESINKLFDNKKNCYTIVIDNCSLSLFRKVLKMKYDKGNNSKIISIYNQPDKEYNDRISNVEYIDLYINDLESIVDKIIENKFPNFNEHQRNTIKQFSEGIPLMAVLLAENVNLGNENIGLLSDKELLNKLLCIENETEKEILKSCSLFKYIGFSDESKEQIDYIVTNNNLTPISGDESFKLACFEKVFFKYTKREIFEIKGRLFGIRPRPLAFYLAEEWIEQCLDDRIERIISDFKNPNNTIGKSLIEPLCQQISFLCYNPKAQSIILALTVPNAPFHNAEVLNTELGSRLFRSFVEVNPIAIANCLWSVFGSMTTDQLKQIDEGRRNLIWTLEKICFDARTYEKGIKLMLMFGSAENEKWSNNATNEFIHLFNIYLPGTQASLAERMEILKWGSKHEAYKTLILKAINSALATNYFTYMGGAENQGTKQLEHYQPKSREEIYEYWTECINIIYTEIINDTIYSDLCSSILTKCVSILCKAGASHIVLPIVKEICNKKRNDWDDMLDSLWLTKTHISYNIESKWQIFIDDLISLLTKNDFVSRFKSVENRFRNPEDNVSFEKRLEKNKNQYEILAKEYVNKWMNDTSILLGLYQIENCFTNPFGYIVAKLNEQNTENVYWFIEKSIECFHSLEKFNPSILYDFAKGLNKDNFDHLVSELYKDRKCSFLLFPIIANRGTALSETQLLFKLVERRDVSANNFLDFWRYSTIIRTSSNSEIITFFSKIINCDKDNGFNVIITMTKNLMFFNKERKFDTIADFITSEFESRKISPKSFMQNNDYLEVIEILLKICNNPQLAIFINKIIIEVSNNPGSNISNDWRIEHIYSILFDKYFKDISQDLFSALSSENLFSELAFQFLLSPKDFSDLSHKLFQQNNIDIILNYCKQSPIAQERIMRIIPAITQDGKFSPLVMELLDNFGNNTEILNSLSSNLLSFSAVGSLIPVYKNRKETFSTLLNHSNPIIADWAQMNINQLEKEIEAEEKREAENKLLYS